MSNKEKFNQKKTVNIIRNSSFINDKMISKSFPKKFSKLTMSEKIKPKLSCKLKYVSNFKKILENENNEFMDDLSLTPEERENREKQLKILNIKYTKLYDSKEKIYSNIIKEIEVEKNFFYKRSIMSFNLIILKIKCLMKILKEKFKMTFNSQDERNLYEVDLNIQKIKNEFKKIYFLLNEDSKYEYEILTQVYCKFLYILAIISNKKEEYIKSLNYIVLGVNMLKVYFIRQKIAINIETYKIYAKLILLLINKFLSDNNISQSLVYINLLSKICEISLIFIHKKKLEKKYEYKFNKYHGYNFLFLGYCYEFKKNFPNNNKISLKAYKEAFYFLNKSNKFSIFAEGKPIVTVEKKAFYLSQLLYEKLKDKLIYEALEKQREYEQQELIKKQLIEEAKSEEKKYRLKLISSGLSLDPEKLVKMQNKLYSRILTPMNQKLIEKLDDELISYVYKNKQDENDNEKKEAIKIKKKSGKLEKKLPSMDIMKNLCHYKIYNSLMSQDFKEFLLNNKRLEFNNPQKQKISLDKIQKFLNRKIEIGSNSDNANKEKEKDIPIMIKTETNINSDSNIKSKILNLKANEHKKSKKNIYIPNTHRVETNYTNYIKSRNNNPLKTSRRSSSTNKHLFIVSRDTDTDNNNNKRLITYSSYTDLPGKIKKKINSKCISNTKSTEFENKKLDKYIFNNKYFKEYIYFDKLTNKELNFQKQFLESKNNNSKMYFKDYDTELSNNGKISREEIFNSFLILNNNVMSRYSNYDKLLKRDKSKSKLVGNVFKSVTNKMKEGKEVKSAMRKVLDRYINEQKKNKKNMNKRNMISVKEINKNNEFSIMKLNDNIEEIKYLLLSKSNEAKINNKF